MWRDGGDGDGQASPAIHLFKGRLQRGELPPAPGAFGLQASLVALIRHTLNPATT